MVFPSVPVYLDPPNWQQRQNHQPGGSSENLQLPLPAPMPPQAAAGGGSSSVRPGSMAERARLAKLPQPEAALKCPRCESINTKFCYFNNYSLTQPRHFCKTCRRYWTRGGALRNVPVGGGCRRNKRSKGSSSKSPVSADRQAGPSSASAIASNSSTMDVMSHLTPPPQLQLPFMNSLHHLADYKVPEIGLNFSDIQPTPSITASTGMDMDFRMAGNPSSMVLSSGMTDQWRLAQMHQFPFLAGLEPPPGLYPFEGEGNEAAYGGGASQLGSKPSGSGVSQLAPVKMEDNQGLNLSRQYLGVPGNEQFWGTNAWTDLSGFNSSSTSHLL